jgi:hypothetical protein
MGLQRFSDAHPSVIFLSLAIILIGLIAVWGVTRGQRWETRAAALGLFAFTLGVFVLLSLTSGIATQGDESLFTRFATEVLRSGGNPYVHNSVSAALHYGAPVSGITTTWDNSFAGSFPYPAGLIWLTSLASAIPFFATPTVALNAVAIGAVIVLLVRKCGWPVAAMYALITMTGEQLAVLGRGNSDIVVVPFLVWLIASIPSLEHHQLRRVVTFGVVLGLALSVKQNAWLLAPFLAIALWGFWRERGGKTLRPLLLTTTVAAAVFLVCNLPFMIRDGSAWWTAVMSPFRSNLIPAGQGLTMIPMHFGGDLSKVFSILPLVTLAIALAVAVRVRGRASLLMVMAGVVPTIVSGRSFLHYMITLAPLALVALSVEVPPSTQRRRTGAFLILVPALVGMLVLYLARTPSSDIQLRKYVVQPGTSQISDVVVRVATTVATHASSYMVSHDGNPFQEWVPTSKDGNLLTLHAPAGATPLLTTTPFQVAAVDRTTKRRYVSSPLWIAPISVTVATSPLDGAGHHHFTVTLKGPARTIAKSTVRVGQTEQVHGGIQPFAPKAPFVFVGQPGNRGRVAWSYECDAGAQSKVYVEVVDQWGQTILRTPAGLFFCDSPISVK